MRFGNWIFLHRDSIGPDKDPYMVRYKLIETPWFAVRVHHICRSDGDRDLHDHPFSFLSFVLWGGYCEWRPSDFGCIQAPWVVYRRAEDLHRLELDRPAWTLVFTGPRRRDWGFQTANGWVPWQQYLAADGDKPAGYSFGPEDGGTVHLAGNAVTLGNRVIQRCLICGEKLCDSRGAAVLEGDDRSFSTWPVGGWVEQVESSPGVTEYSLICESEQPQFEESAIPVGCCVELVEN